MNDLLKEHSISSEPSEYIDFSTINPYSTDLLIDTKIVSSSTQQTTKRQFLRHPAQPAQKVQQPLTKHQFLHPPTHPAQKARQQQPLTRRQFLDPTSHIASSPLSTRQASFISSVSQ